MSENASPTDICVYFNPHSGLMTVFEIGNTIGGHFCVKSGLGIVLMTDSCIIA